MPSATSSNFLHNAQMNYLLHNTSWTPPTSLYVALFVTAPGLDGTGGTEVATGGGTAYARVAIAVGQWAGPSGANLEYSNIADLTFNVPTANWGTISAAGLYDAETVGNMFYVAYLTTPKTVNNGDGAPKILANQLRITRATC